MYLKQIYTTCDDEADKRALGIYELWRCTSCTVGQTQNVSYTIGWAASATADEWLTGGFDVSVSWTAGTIRDAPPAKSIRSVSSTTLPIQLIPWRMIVQ